MPSYKSNTSEILTKLKAFSLVEVLMTLLIMSLIIVALAPVITKKITQRSRAEGIVYTYTGSMQPEENLCFSTEAESYMTPEQKRVSSTRCSEYTFTVPEGVTSIDLTLVAGGGGGGGASGSTLEQHTLTSIGGENVTETVDFDRIKDITINYLTARGSYANSYNLYAGCDTQTDDEAQICATQGGKSSSAIVDFKLPDIRNLGAGYVTPLDYTLAANQNITLGSDAANITTEVQIGNLITYAVEPPVFGDPVVKVICNTGGTSYLYNNANFSSICKIPASSIYPEVEGKLGQYLLTDAKTLSETVLYGGEGGSINTRFATYGSGAKGYDIRVNCRNSFECNARRSEASPVVVGNAPEPGKSFASVTYTTEVPGGVAAGGTGGNAVRILGYKVTPGETYTIRVGAGGEGGRQGTNGTLEKAPTRGENGGGGTSTAIYDANDNVIFMVMGGQGGQGGNLYAHGNDFPLFPYGNTVTSWLVLSNPGDAASGYLTNGTFDRNFINMAELERDDVDNWPNGVNMRSGIKLSYNYLLENPFCALNSGANDFKNADCTDRSTSLGAFFPFSQGTGNAQLIPDTLNIGKMTEPVSLNNVYDGLYFRSVIGNYPAYTGGPGGLSGLGTKAGCGGLFMGNNGEHTAQDGDDEDRTETLNRIIIDEISYNITDFYDNCSLSTPDGQSANFVLPTVNGPTFGSAGAGGGGGAWSPTLGAGKGGRGQDGYLMIEWRR